MQPEIILIGMFMGIAFAAPPGAVTAETFRRGARGGFALALGVQLGSLIGDATYAIVALAGLAAIAENHALQIALGALGAMFLMYLAWTSFRLTPSPVETVHASSLRGRGEGRAFLSGLALSLTNPWAIAFWLSLGGALTTFGVAGASAPQIAWFFFSFMLGSALWAFSLSFAIAYVRRWIRPPLFRFVSALCGIALGAFGLLAASRVVVQIIGA